MGALLPLLNGGCAVPIKDETFYVDAGPSGAITVNFLSPGSQIIPKEQWDAMREGDFCMSPQAFGDFKSEIEQLCSAYSCSWQVTSQTKAFFSRANAVAKVHK